MRLLAGVAAVLCVTAVTCDARPAAHAGNRNRAIMVDFAHRFYDLHDVRGAFERYVAPDYIQHNPGIADGRAAAITALAPMFAKPGGRFEVKRILVDGDLAAVHLRGSADPAKPGATVADFYRLKNGKIVEHWDVIQPIAADTANPHPYF